MILINKIMENKNNLDNDKIMNNPTITIINKSINDIISEVNREVKLKKIVVPRVFKPDDSYKRERFDCPCGGVYMYLNKSNHLKSIKHKKFIDTNVKHVSITAGFSHRKEFLDKETLEKRRQWYRDNYKKRKEREHLTIVAQGKDNLP